MVARSSDRVGGRSRRAASGVRHPRAGVRAAAGGPEPAATMAAARPAGRSWRTGGAPRETAPTVRLPGSGGRGSGGARGRAPGWPRRGCPRRPPVGRRLREAQRLGPRLGDVLRLRPPDLRRPDDVHEPAVDRGSGRAPGPERGRGDRRRAVRRRGQPPARRPLRAAGDPRGPVHLRLDPLAPARATSPSTS